MTCGKPAVFVPNPGGGGGIPPTPIPGGRGGMPPLNICDKSTFERSILEKSIPWNMDGIGMGGGGTPPAPIGIPPTPPSGAPIPGREGFEIPGRPGKEFLDGIF
jgi:hypothetical protein